MDIYIISAIILLSSPVVTQDCRPCTCTSDKLYGGTKVTCSKLNLAIIPEQLPQNTTTFLVDGNNLTNLTGPVFKKFAHLRFLDLSSNVLEMIDETAFNGLHRLLVLNLSTNRLILDSTTYRKNVFRPLHGLTVLRIEDNNNLDSETITNNTYPDESFRFLTSLKELHLDGIPADFGPGFADIKTLSSLTLSGLKKYCKLPVLRNTMFMNVRPIRHLNISHCLVTGTELLTFVPLKNIKTIDVSSNINLGFAGFMNATFGLQHSPIKVLNMNYIHPEYDVCSTLKVEHIKYLQNTKLKALHVDGNGIIAIETGALSTLPRSLEYASAKYNKFQFGWYMLETSQLISLKYVDVSGINKAKPLPFLKRHAVNSPFGFDSHGFLDTPVPVPPSLEALIAADCSFSGHITQGGVDKNNIKKVIVNNNFFSGLEGPITGFEKTELFDFSNNVLELIGEEYFPLNNSVLNLSLANNYLGNSIGNDINRRIFERLVKVRFLDLSNNRISDLPIRIFAALVNIDVINISDNFLENFNVDLSNNRNLSMLNLRGNKLQMLPQEVLKDLNHSSIRLADNPLLCSCGSLNFLQWVKENTARVVDINHTTCTLTTSGLKVSFNKLDYIIMALNVACNKSHNTLITSVTVSLFLFTLGTISVGICYRHRWKLRYLYHVGRRAYRLRHDVDHGDDDTFQYDVFISYAAPDRRFVIDFMMSEFETKAGLKMCIHDRDFIPGDVIATSIVNAIQNSRKTLILLSPSFLESDWCEFEYNMARMESVAQRRNIVVVVLYKYVPLKDLPKDMALMFRNNCYLEYNEEEFGSVMFWENVVEAIKSNRQNE